MMLFVTYFMIRVVGVIMPTLRFLTAINKRREAYSTDTNFGNFRQLINVQSLYTPSPKSQAKYS